MIFRPRLESRMGHVSFSLSQPRRSRGADDQRRTRRLFRRDETIEHQSVEFPPSLERLAIDNGKLHETVELQSILEKLVPASHEQGLCAAFHGQIGISRVVWRKSVALRMDCGADSSPVKFRKIERFLVALACSDTHGFDDALLPGAADCDLRRAYFLARVVHLEKGFVGKRRSRHGSDLESRDAYIRRALKNGYRGRT